MLLWLVLGLVVIGAIVWYVNRDRKIDSNNDGKVDLAEVKVAVENTVAEVKTLADVNKDGQVTVADVKETVKKTKSSIRKAASKAKKPKLSK